jgi:dTMP kinase
MSRARPGARLIAIIGIDGAGKSTQVEAIRRELTGYGRRIFQLPNESLQPLWERLDEFCRGAGEDFETYLGVDVVQMLASGVKWVSLEKAWHTLDEAADVILADRYSYCQVAIAQRADERTRSAITHLYEDFPAPDVCIWLDVAPELALGRLRRRGERWRDLAFLEVHRRGYEKLAAEHDFIVIDGTPPTPDVTAAIVREVRRLLPELFNADKPSCAL